MTAPSAADLAATVRDVLSGRLGTHEAAVLAMDALDALLARCQEAERDSERWRLVACNVKDGTAAAEHQGDEYYRLWQTEKARAESAERERDEARADAEVRKRLYEASVTDRVNLKARVAELEQALLGMMDCAAAIYRNPNLPYDEYQGPMEVARAALGGTA